MIDAIEERKKKLHAEIMVLEQRKQELLCLTHSKPAKKAAEPDIDDDDLTEDELADKYFITNDSENQTLIYKRGYISNYE